MTTPSGAPPQYSDDGRWWWDGHQWVPVPPPQPQAPPQPRIPLQPQSSHYMPQYGAGYPMYGPAPAELPPQADGRAIASLVLGILWLGGLASILAVVFGHMSRSAARQQSRRPSGVTVAGLILGYIGIVGAALFWLALVAASGAAKDAQAHFNDLQVRSQLQGASLAEETYYVDHAAYTTSIGELRQYDFVPSTDAQLDIVSADANDYCLTAATVGGGSRLYFSHSRGFSTEACD